MLLCTKVHLQHCPRISQGHEGLGIVSKVGSLVEANMGLKEGDIVATRGEPGFADYYNAKMGTFIKVQSRSQVYIRACSMW